MECNHCKGKRVAKGSLQGGHGNLYFAPSGLKFGLRPSRGTAIQSFACLDCGLVWSSTPPTELDDFIREHCDQDIEQV